MVKKYIGADEVKTIVPQVSIFEIDDFERELEKLGSDAAKADAITSRTTRSCTEKMEDDPTFYKRLSALIEEAIEDYRARRISEKEYLEKAKAHMKEVQNAGRDSKPEILYEYKDAPAYYGTVNESLAKYGAESENNIEDISAEVAIKAEEVIEKLKIRDWQNNKDIQNEIFNELEDFLLQLNDRYQIKLSYDDIDLLLEEVLQIAKRRG